MTTLVHGVIPSSAAHPEEAPSVDPLEKIRKARSLLMTCHEQVIGTLDKSERCEFSAIALLILRASALVGKAHDHLPERRCQVLTDASAALKVMGSIVRCETEQMYSDEVMSSWYWDVIDMLDLSLTSLSNVVANSQRRPKEDAPSTYCKEVSHA